MKTTALWNAGLFVAAVVTSTVSGWSSKPRATTPDAVSAPAPTGAATPPTTDATGTVVPPGDYRRIASLSTVGDALLLELCEPDRIVSFTGYSVRSAPRSYRYKGKPTVESIADLEGVLALRPDLVLVSAFGDPRPVARLRDAGLVVFDLGSMLGLTTLLPNIASLAALLGQPERGRRLAASLVTEMNAVAADIPVSRRARGMYVSVYGGHLFGGVARTSFGDVLHAAGLLDATPGYRDFPEYATEQLLAIDPDVIVTNLGMRDRICSHAGFAQLRACNAPNGVVDVDDGLLGDAGPGMLDAANEVRARIYGPPPASGTGARPVP